MSWDQAAVVRCLNSLGHDLTESQKADALQALIGLMAKDANFQHACRIAGKVIREYRATHPDRVGKTNNNERER